VERAGGSGPIHVRYITLVPTNIELVRPRRVEDVSRALAEAGGDGLLVAGGTAVILMLRQGLIEPRTLVALEDVSGLDQMEVRNDALHIGARVTLAEVAASHVVRSRAAALAHACNSVGNLRVRNVATLAGNLAEADYASDPPSLLACLNASCSVQGLTRARSVPVRQLITGFLSTSLSPDEVITGVHVPLARPGEGSVYLKYSSRSSEDRPCIGVAARAALNDGSISALDVVVGAVSSTPVAVREVTDAAVGRPLDDASIADVADGYADSIEPIDDVRGSSWYRTQMIRVFVRRALQALRRGS
jgi:aerobic carbon-monoxide dehydrogenase medium subunit